MTVDISPVKNRLIELKTAIHDLCLLWYEALGVFVGALLSGIASVKLLAPDVFDRRPRKGNNNLIYEDMQKKQSFDYQDRQRKIRFVWAWVLVAGITLVIFCAYLSFLSALAIYLSH